MSSIAKACSPDDNLAQNAGCVSTLFSCIHANQYYKIIGSINACLWCLEGETHHVIVEASTPEPVKHLRITPDPYGIAKVCICHTHPMIGLDIGNVLRWGNLRSGSEFFFFQHLTSKTLCMRKVGKRQADNQGIRQCALTL
jgi:hypothetical protein